MRKLGILKTEIRNKMKPVLFLKLWIKGWRRTDMPSWVAKACCKEGTKRTLYGKTLFFKGKNFTYRVYTSMPEFQGDSGDIYCYKKLRKK